MLGSVCFGAFGARALQEFVRRRERRGEIQLWRLDRSGVESEGPARTALKETAYYLGIGIANLIRGLAPEAVIVGGPIVRAWP
jgi:predicted NBD/HSP70 family sugar kinase